MPLGVTLPPTVAVKSQLILNSKDRMKLGTRRACPRRNVRKFSNNRVFDNWQYGTFLIAIPDVVAGEAEGNLDPDIHCPLIAPCLAA